MPDSHNRTTENELAEVILQILADTQTGTAFYSELMHEIPNHIELTEEDKQSSETRPSEKVWEQRVRNITSHKESPENYINRGYLESIPDGLKITEPGRERARG